MGIKKWKCSHWGHTWLERAITYQSNVRYSEVRIKEIQKWKHRCRRRRCWYWSCEEGRIQKSYWCHSWEKGSSHKNWCRSWEEGRWRQNRESCWCRSSNSLPASSLQPLFLLPSGWTFASSSRHPYNCVTLSSSYVLSSSFTSCCRHLGPIVLDSCWHQSNAFHH